MNYLQQYLDEIEAEAAVKSIKACANAELIERAGEVMARLNEAMIDGKAYATHHIDSHEPSVTLQGSSAGAFIDALEACGYALGRLPTKTRHSFFGEVCAIVTIEPGIEALLRGQKACLLAAEALPCAA